MTLQGNRSDIGMLTHLTIVSCRLTDEIYLTKNLTDSEYFAVDEIRGEDDFFK